MNNILNSLPWAACIITVIFAASALDKNVTLCFFELALVVIVMVARCVALLSDIYSLLSKQQGGKQDAGR